MKKLLGIVVLGLLCCNVGVAEKIVRLPKDTASGYQNSADCDFIVAIWKMTPAGDTTHTYNAAVDFIGEIEFTANADTSTMHTTQAITSFQSGASLSAGDCICVFGKVGAGGTGSDRSYWWINGAIEVEYS